MKKWLAILLIIQSLSFVYAKGADDTPVDEVVDSVDIYLWSDGNDGYSKLVDLYNAQDPEVRINPKYIIQTEYDSKLTTLLAAGMPMDAFFQKTPVNMFPQYNNGYIEPLNDLIERNNFDYSQLSAWDSALRIDGEVVALPHRGGKWYTYYNAKAFEEKGIPTPTEFVEKGEWTWAKYVEISQLMSENDGETFGSLQYTWPICQIPSTIQEGMGFIDKDGNIDVNDSLLKAFKIRKTLEDGNDMPGLIDLKVTKTHYSKVFFEGHSPMVLMGEWFPVTFSNGIQEGLVKDMGLEDLRITRLPSDTPEYVTFGTPTVGHVSSSSKKKDAAFKVLAWLAGAEGALLETQIGFLPPTFSKEAQEVMSSKILDEKSLEYFSEDVPVISPYLNKYGSSIDQAISLYMEKYLLGEISDEELVPAFRKEMQRIVDTLN